MTLARQNKFATSKQKQADPTGKQVAVPSKSTSGKLGRRPSVILVGIDRRLRYVTGASTWKLFPSVLIARCGSTESSRSTPLAQTENTKLLRSRPPWSRRHAQLGP